MSYDATTDFLALSRQTSGGVRSERMPGLDYMVAALARAGFITLAVGQTAPSVNQVSTAWLKPALPSWTAEGLLYLWNAATSQYEPATVALWTAFLSPGLGGYSFQSIASASGGIVAGTSLLAVQRNNPAATALTLPTLAAQYATGRKLQVVDFSTSIVNHVITITTPDGSTIMQRASLRMQSTADNLASVMLTPSPDLNAWVIAP